MDTEESSENTEVLSGEETSEEQLLQRLRARSILLNLDLAAEEVVEENEENKLRAGEKAEVREEDSVESGFFLMPMTMDNPNSPASTGKTKKEIYDYMTVDIPSQNFNKDKSNLMDIEFSRKKIKKTAKTKPKDTGLSRSLQDKNSKGMSKIKNTGLNRKDKKRASKAGLAKNLFLIKVETEVEEIMDIYYCKKTEDKWKLQL